MSKKNKEKEPHSPQDGTQEEPAIETQLNEESSKEVSSGENAPSEDKVPSEAEKAAAQIEKLTADLADSNAKYLYLMAEFDTYRRRMAKERIEMIDSASKDVLVGFLPVVDDCERALQVLKESDASEAAKEGTELIFNKLMSFLKSRGIEPIDAKGKDFDTDYHEAVAQFPAPSPEMKNKVIDVTQTGYTLKGKVVRFAKVVVGV